MPLPYYERTCYCAEVGEDHVGKTVLITGWVQNRRDHGGMVFIDVRDRTGLVQLKFNPDSDPRSHEIAGRLRAEYCVAVRGEVAARPEGLVNPNLASGAVEIKVHEIDILSESATPPFDIADDTEANEELRLKYRYLDLRRPVLQRSLITRHRIVRAIREHFDREGFVEIETPILTKSTPEGARDYLVPSRVHPGRFYALPQSPQIFKQLLMISGFDKYVQIARCFRDEDLRADRQPEFTQLDMEMSFVQAENVFDVIERCMAHVMKQIHGVDIPRPFPRVAFDRAMDEYGTDAPDTRYDMKLIDVSAAAKKSEFRVFADALAAGGVVRAMRVPGGATMTRKETDRLADDLRGIGAGGLPLVKVAKDDDSRIAFQTGVAKFFTPETTAEIAGATGAGEGDLLFFAAGAPADVCKHLSWLRTVVARKRDLIPRNEWHFLWIVDVPMFEWNADEKRWDSMHHPFTAPRDEDVPLLDSDPGRVLSQGYDLVLNGTELGSGSVRIHRADVQRKIFGLLNITPEQQQLRFGFLLDALRYGPPPHGGIALGLDRIMMLLTGMDSLRDTLSFPKTAKAQDLMTEAPSPVEEQQLRELALKSTAATEATPT